MPKDVRGQLGLYTATLSIARLHHFLLLSLLALPRPAFGQGSECAASSDRGYETFPGAGASRVALDAPIRVRLQVPRKSPPSTDQLFGAVEVRATDDARVGAALDGHVQWLGTDTLWFQPSNPLEPSTRYQVVVASWVAGTTVTFEFTSGEAVDQGPPELTIDDASVLIDSRLAPASCGLPAGSYMVDMALLLGSDGSHPMDDADDGSVEYLAFLSRAKGLSAPRLLARTRRAGQTDDPVLRFVLTPNEAQAAVCVVLHAYDGVLRRAEAEPEICFDPVDAAYFHGMCTLSLPQSRGTGSQPTRLLVFLIALALILRRSTGRPARPR